MKNISVSIEKKFNSLITLYVALYICFYFIVIATPNMVNEVYKDFANEIYGSNSHTTLETIEQIQMRETETKKKKKLSLI